MKKFTIVLLIAIVLPFIKSSAQNPNRDKMNAYKIAFFTKKINLTFGEAEKFWPVYNDYQSQKNKIQLEKISIIKDFNQNESTMNDKQISELGDRLIDAVAKESSIAVAFHSKIKSVLPPAKVIRFYQAENQYKVQLLNDLQNARQQQQRVGPRRNMNQ